jgi:hypothetical protein
VDEREAWIAANAAQARAALDSAEVRDQIAGLLGADDRAQRRTRRLQAAREELACLELRVRVEERWEP